jgi:hypothetical protein
MLGIGLTVPFSVGDNEGALVVADGELLGVGASLVLEPQAVNIPMPMIAAPPARSAIRWITSTGDMDLSP